MSQLSDESFKIDTNDPKGTVQNNL